MHFIMLTCHGALTWLTDGQDYEPLSSCDDQKFILWVRSRFRFEAPPGHQ
jgi:hypothetical protein